MTPNPPPAAELLAAHAASLRVLARHLVGDPHAAEDALQDTWVLALERPPARADALGAWLRTVLRNVVTNRRRGEARRLAREAAVARPETREGSHDARARTLRAVVEAVLALDEPYRATVLSRWFEDLPPREIARREGVSVHTVESRLQRALAKLRARLARELEDEVGGPRHALLLLAGLRPAGAGLALGAATATGALVVGTKAKIAFAGTTAALAAWLLWLAWPEPAGPVVAAAPRIEESSLRQAQAPAQEELPRAQGAAALVDAPGHDPVPPAPPTGLRLSLLVTTTEGMPVPGATVLAAPDRLALNEVARTGPDGLAHVGIPAAHAPDWLVVAARHPVHGLAGPWRLRLLGRERADVRLALDPGLLLDSEAIDSVTRDESRAGLERRWNQSRGHAALLRLLFAPAARRDGERLQLVASSPIDAASAAHAARSLAALGYGPDGSAAAQSPPSDTSPGGARLVGSVLDRSQRPVEGALVAAGTELDPFARWTRTDELGAFLIDGLPAGRLEQHAYAVGLGDAGARSQAWAGQVLTWEARLDPARRHAGRLVLDRDEPLQSMRMEWLVADRGELDVRGTRSAEDGTWALAQLPKERAALIATPAAMRLPLVLDTSVRARSGGAEHRLRARDLDAGELRLLVAHPAPTGPVARTDDSLDWLGDLKRVEARVWTDWKPAHAQRGTWMDRDGTPGAFVLADVPPGRYRIEVGSDALGWTETGPVQVGPGEVVDLGLLRLPVVGGLRVERAGSATGERCLVRNERVETWLGTIAPGSARELLLAPGEYLLHDPDDRSRGFAFSLAAGERVVVGDAGVLGRGPLR